MRTAIFRFWEIEAYNKLGKLKAHIVCPDMINFHKFQGILFVLVYCLVSLHTKFV